MPEKGKSLEIGKGRIVQEGREKAKTKVAILSIGTRYGYFWRALIITPHYTLSPFSAPMNNHSQPSSSPLATSSLFLATLHTYRLGQALEAANTLEENDPDLGVTVADARFMKPLDIDLLRKVRS